jgi:hypothetical protein
MSNLARVLGRQDTGRVCRHYSEIFCTARVKINLLLIQRCHRREVVAMLYQNFCLVASLTAVPRSLPEIVHFLFRILAWKG